MTQILKLAAKHFEMTMNLKNLAQVSRQHVWTDGRSQKKKWRHFFKKKDKSKCGNARTKEKAIIRNDESIYSMVLQQAKKSVS